MRRIDTKRLTLLSSLVAVAMILSYVEFLIPISSAMPGMKLGLSNIATVFALYTLGAPSAVCVSVVRVVLSSIIFGSVSSFAFSLGGAALALGIMILTSRMGIFSPIGISTAGAVMHNVGQTLVACLMMENAAITTYLAPLTVSGTVAGLVIGIVSGLLVDRLDGYMKKYVKSKK